MRTSFGGSWFLFLIAATLAGPAAAGSPPRVIAAEIAIIIDDLGQQHQAGLRAIRLPGPVALAFLPNTEHATVQSEYAARAGKEVLLHLPLEPAGAARAYPTAIRADTDRAGLRRTFAEALASVPHARGVNNHQGSLVTEMSEPIGWLMAELRARPELYFVDSRTTGSSVAYRMARMYGVPAAERNVFLDHARDEATIRKQFQLLVAKALQDERALAIGHPYPETLRVLEEELPKLEARGIRLVPPSELIARQGGYRGPFKQLKIIPTLTLAKGGASGGTTTASAQ